jgi:hypothetical protein
MDEQFWRNAPKTYCDNANMAATGGTGDMFLLGLMSGGQAQVFAFTPEHIKRTYQMMSHNIKEYEKKQGEIKVDEWNPEVKSPLQVQDLGKN